MVPTDPTKPRTDGSPKEITQRWEAAECPFAIDYSTSVMSQIRQSAEEAFYALPHGGLEIGGVLFGRVSPNARSPLRLEIVAQRPIECKHADGPWLVLSDEEKVEVGNLLARSRVDPELSAFSVAGFWISHGRGDLELTENDLGLYNSLFPNPWQVALVLKPQMAAPTRATFFFRAEGEIVPHTPGHVFVVGVLPEAPPSAPELPAAPSSEKYKPIPKERRTDLGSDAPPEVVLPPKSFWTLRKVAIVLLMLLAAEIGAGLATWLWSLRRPQRDLVVEVFSAGQDLLVHWNARAYQVEHAQSGELVFDQQGSTQLVPLDLPAVQRGYMRYRPGIGEVKVTLRITEKDGHVDQAVATPR